MFIVEPFVDEKWYNCQIWISSFKNLSGFDPWAQADHKLLQYWYWYQWPFTKATLPCGEVSHANNFKIIHISKLDKPKKVQRYCRKIETFYLYSSKWKTSFVVWLSPTLRYIKMTTIFTKNRSTWQSKEVWLTLELLFLPKPLLLASLHPTSSNKSGRDIFIQ